MTMLFATHEMAFAREISDRVCFLHEGRVLEHYVSLQGREDGRLLADVLDLARRRRGVDAGSQGAS